MDFLVKPNLQVFFVFFLMLCFLIAPILETEHFSIDSICVFQIILITFSLIIFYHLLMTIMLTIFFLKISTPVTTTITYIRASKSFACLTFTYLLSHFTSDPEITVFQ